MNKETVHPLYQLLIEQYLLYYRLGFEMLIEDELSELKGAESGLKNLALDHQLLKDAQNRKISMVGHLLDPMLNAIETLGTLNAFTDMQDIINDLAYDTPAEEVEEDDRLLRDMIKHIPDYESKPPIVKLFIRFMAVHGTFSMEVSDIVAQVISRETAEPITLGGGAWEDQSPVLRPHADSNDLILLDMLDEMNRITQNFLMAK